MPPPEPVQLRRAIGNGQVGGANDAAANFPRVNLKEDAFGAVSWAGACACVCVCVCVCVSLPVDPFLLMETPGELNGCMWLGERGSDAAFDDIAAGVGGRARVKVNSDALFPMRVVVEIVVLRGVNA